MYYLDSKHAFKMFIKKTRSEFKSIFQDSTEGLEAQRYKLHLESVEEKAKALGIEPDESLPGSINFQVRFVKVEKSIQLHCFAHHEWKNPPTNAKDKRQWGMLKIPIVTLKEEEKLPEKYNLRKMEFQLSCSYTTKQDEDNNWNKYTGKEWVLDDELERKATANLKEKHAVNVKGNKGSVEVEEDDRDRASWKRWGIYYYIKK